ncbi:MAG TPA: choice-of-anchor Q domain-containing protein, partial [Polyangiaceae bacterium]|nr:choice-of-anchor Q domain-containing protein [Polyangiaceae bacterium]
YVDGSDGKDTNDGLTEATPVQSPTKVPASCTVVKFKRGSAFKLAKGVKNLGIPSMNGYTTKVTTLTNYGDASAPLPKFEKDHVDGSGSLVDAMSQLTIDGLYLSGSKSANDMGQLGDGIGVRLMGAGSKLINSEITLCDIGVMTSADNIQVLNNYIHDLSISVDAPPGVDPNAVGGAEGIFVNSSHVEVAYNRFVNCSTAAQWVTNTNGGGVRCDGGATEVTVPNGKNGAAGVVTDVRIHHNFSYNSCGFFEVSSMFQQGSTDYVKGEFTDSIFHDNVMVDSGWISLLQINNTKLKNVTWANNTIVHHDRGTITDADGTKINLNDYGSSAIQVIAFNSTSSGATGGGEISPGDIYWKNNLWYFDPKVKPYSAHSATTTSSDQFIKNIVVTGDKIFTTDPGFLDITSTTDPTAYDLKSTATDVIDQGADVEGITSDFRDRPRPAGASFDLGAFEYQPNAGGASTGAMNTTTPSTGSQPSATKASGGAGGQSSATKANPSGVGGQGSATPGSANGNGGQSGATKANPADNGGQSGDIGTSSTGNGGQSNATQANPVGNGGSSNSADVSGGSVKTSDATGTHAGSAEATDGCSCSVPNSQSRGSFALLVAVGACLLGSRARQRRARSTVCRS